MPSAERRAKQDAERVRSVPSVALARGVPRDGASEPRPLRRYPAAPAPFAATCRYLSGLPGVDAVQAIAFPVLPAEDVEPKTSPTPTR